MFARCFSSIFIECFANMFCAKISELRVKFISSKMVAAKNIEFHYSHSKLFPNFCEEILKCENAWHSCSRAQITV